MKDKIVLFLSTFFYLGYISFASGTFGTLGAVPFYYLLVLYLNKYQYLVFTIIFILVSIYLSSLAAKIFNRDDPGEVVIDEVAGFLTTMAFIPFTLENLIIGFLLFRFFDILKPFPSRQLEKLKGGYGIVLDDVASGIWANLLLLIYIKY